MRTMPRMSGAAILVSLLMVIGVMLMFTACGSSDTGGADENVGPTSTIPDGSTPTTTPGGETETDGVVLAMSDLPRTTPAASQDDILSAAAGMQQLGIDLYGVLAQGAGDGNLVFSPASIVTALAMTYAGAAGTTAEEMASTLQFALAGDTLHQAFNSLDTALESRSWQGKNPEGKDQGVVVRTANSLWGQRDTVFEQIFLDTLAADYGAGMRLVDYKTAAEDARVAINEWVADETEDKITDLIPEGALNALTRLVLVNAVYLDATWASQFDPELTQDGRFTTLAGDPVTASMMFQSSSFPYASGDGWQAVELPYLLDEPTRGELSMLLIVPEVGRFSEVESRLTGRLIDDAVVQLALGPEVNLTMPKFEFRTQAGLNDALTVLGMASAFNPATADFSGMTTQEALFISDVIHEAYIAVDEEGTEAAAATAVVMRATAAPMETVELTIDRPFLFALRDRDTGALLFLGRVTDPTA
jgi:serpin B